MLIGMMYAMLVTRADPQKTISKFFDGMGKGYGSILASSLPPAYSPPVFAPRA